jgi:hypothetical protein
MTRASSTPAGTISKALLGVISRFVGHGEVAIDISSADGDAGLHLGRMRGFSTPDGCNDISCHAYDENERDAGSKHRETETDFVMLQLLVLELTWSLNFTSQARTLLVFVASSHSINR